MNTSPPPAGGSPAEQNPGVVLDTQHRDDAILLVCGGEIDTLTAPQLTAAVSAALEQHPRTVVVDLDKVDFLASAGLAALVESHRMTGENTRLHIVATGSATLRPLKLTGLTAELAVFPTAAEALAR